MDTVFQALSTAFDEINSVLLPNNTEAEGAAPSNEKIEIVVEECLSAPDEGQSAESLGPRVSSVSSAIDWEDRPLNADLKRLSVAIAKLFSCMGSDVDFENAYVEIDTTVCEIVGQKRNDFEHHQSIKPHFLNFIGLHVPNILNNRFQTFQDEFNRVPTDEEFITLLTQVEEDVYAFTVKLAELFNTIHQSPDTTLWEILERKALEFIAFDSYVCDLTDTELRICHEEAKQGSVKLQSLTIPGDMDPEDFPKLSALTIFLKS